MGTVGYMAPEQVRGDLADHRADIFAFGAVLYEMLAGRRAFERATRAETMTAILREDAPPLTSVRSSRAARARAGRRALPGEAARGPLPVGPGPGLRSRRFRDRLGRGGPRSPDQTVPAGSQCAARARGCGRRRGRWSFSPRARSRISGFQRMKGAADAPRRIAVLPLQSSDPAFEFFAEGVGDAIYSQLMKVPGLVVTGRGSSAAFRGQAIDLKDVRSRLGVDAVLQGRVSRSGRQVRIALDLVKTADGAALWSGNYDSGRRGGGRGPGHDRSRGRGIAAPGAGRRAVRRAAVREPRSARPLPARARQGFEPRKGRPRGGPVALRTGPREGSADVRGLREHCVGVDDAGR